MGLDGILDKFSPYKPTVKTSVIQWPIRFIFELHSDCIPVLVTSKFGKDCTKGTNFLDILCILSIGAIRCHGNQSFGKICPKTYLSLSPSQ